jgi:hypothetical protein
LLARCFAELFYDPKDGDDTLLRNVGYHSTHYTASYPRRRYSSSHVGFVVEKVALGQVFSEYFGFPCQPSFHQLLHNHLSSGAGTIGQIVADMSSGLSITPPREIKKKKINVASSGDRKFGMDLEESGRGLIKAPSRYFSVGGERKTARTSVRIAVVPAEIRTKHLSNESLERYL